jgi:hypothetical protein
LRSSPTWVNRWIVPSRSASLRRGCGDRRRSLSVPTRQRIRRSATPSLMLPVKALIEETKSAPQ